MAAPRICVPGERLGSLDQYEASSGTYTRHGDVYSSLAGYVSVTKQSNGKITNVSTRFCKCIILCVADMPLKENFRGMIRKEDVRATEKDRVEMYKSFRPGDIVIAKVLSLGDAQSYLLTTAENELGVVLAQSEAGVNMIPISWCEMQCPKTHIKEFRKVAKVQPQHILAS
ncbi:exosome complex component CSL4-like isoform X2 [Ptychodera flava]|uniref:exosome complex component CSL4-like isoform X2 n=1 Tax=Ptychodera flava TaxID=63121 RepID=UPI00396A43B6